MLDLDESLLFVRFRLQLWPKLVTKLRRQVRLRPYI